MTAVSCMAQLTAVSSWLTSGHQICCWDGCARPFSFLLYEDEYKRHQQDGAPPHYHRDVRAYPDNTSPDRCIGRRGSVDHLPTISRFNPTWLFLVGLLEGCGVEHKAINTTQAPASTPWQQNISTHVWNDHNFEFWKCAEGPNWFSIHVWGSSFP